MSNLEASHKQRQAALRKPTMSGSDDASSKLDQAGAALLAFLNGFTLGLLFCARRVCIGVYYAVCRGHEAGSALEEASRRKFRDIPWWEKLSLIIGVLGSLATIIGLALTQRQPDRRGEGPKTG